MLNNLSVNLQQEEPTVCFDTGLRVALIFADKLIGKLQYPGFIHVSGFNHEKITGLFFHNEKTRRAVKVTNHPVSGEVMIHCGEIEFFDFPSRASSDQVYVRINAEEQMDVLVGVAAMYLTRH